MALNAFFAFGSITLSLATIVVGHATFCIVIVYNNLIARLRRTPTSFSEASMDLGANGWQTFRHVTLPTISTALVSGALLAFALSFDEVIVTTFTAGAQNTLPLWIFGAIRLGQRLPEVNVIVFLIILVTIVPVALAARLSGAGGLTRGSVADSHTSTPLRRPEVSARPHNDVERPRERFRGPIEASLNGRFRALSKR